MFKQSLHWKTSLTPNNHRKVGWLLVRQKTKTSSSGGSTCFLMQIYIVKQPFVHKYT